MLDTCTVGGPIGFENDPALSKKSPGRLPRVSRTTALWRRPRRPPAGRLSVCAQAGEQDARRVAAPARFRERGLPYERIHERNRHGFCQPDLSIATERSEPTAHSFPVGEGSVE